MKLFVSVPVCFLGAWYFGKTLFLRRQEFDWQRFLLYCGYAIGSLFVVFAPGTLTRASASGFNVSVNIDMFQCARFFWRMFLLLVEYPHVLFALSVAFVGVVKGRSDTITNYIFSFVVLSLVFSVFAGGKGARAFWPGAAVAFGLIPFALKQMRMKSFGKSRCVMIRLSSLMFGCVFGCTLCRTLEKNGTLEIARMRWLDDPLCIMVVDSEFINNQRSCWFDRSFCGILAWGRFW